MAKRHTISFAGAGRLAGILCHELVNAGFRIDTIVSESAERGPSLAGTCNARWSDKLSFSGSEEVIIVAVPDNRLKAVLDKIECSEETLIAHSAGSMGLEAFPARVTRRSVFYPLQTFSHGRKVVFKDLPVFIEASDECSAELLGDMADALGAKKYFSDAAQRRMLHLAAVFACNFSNHMLTKSSELATRSGYSFEELKPLIRETFMKALDAGPENSQTGPAVRNDKNTIEKHLELLSFDADLQKIYREISESIFKYHHKL